MKKIALLALLAIPGLSLAAVNLSINVPYQTVVQPNTGFVDVIFTGTVDVLLPTFDVTALALEFPSNGTSFLTASFDAGFIAYQSSNSPGLDYSGNLFKVTVLSTDAQGFYWLNNSGLGFSPLSELIVTVSDGVQTASDNEFYGVNVVPEPLTVSALGLGVIALLRRRRKS